ncbi:MAG: outer membrane lipoprotein-sorting protein [Bacteroidota bacterium]|nr:outer membrane lipoprotein-sorting protein [Bacteroidota bacterium]MDP4243971.1 outer membrane lipoprotein-sorting protein [Bacteroidota bacterium]MDP4288179.1 outer membrane lipoprotein-sorting protein [Bacteroidota bacterium]
MTGTARFSTRNTRSKLERDEARVSIIRSSCEALIFLFAFSSLAFGQDATEIVRRADLRMRGASSEATMTIQIVRPAYSREMSMRTWSKGNDFALILITAPAKEKGTVFLKRKKEVWNWLPSIERTIKLPPSMMSQSWMGTDFTNDDLVREASIVEDYDQRLLGEESIGSEACYKIELLPKKEAAVVWGKVFLWVEKTNDLMLRAEYYDEDGTLINTMIGSDIKMLGGRLIPARMEMIPADKKGNKTVLIYSSLVFDRPIDDSFFGTQNMQRVR